jgi:octaprenyl-diphosphate synthase
MGRSDAATRALLRRALEEGDAEAMPEVQAAIAEAGSLAYSLERARDHARAAERALDGLAPNAALAALRGLARYAVDRDR